MNLKAAAFAAIIATAGLPATAAGQSGLTGEQVVVQAAQTPAETHKQIRREAWRMCRAQAAEETSRKALKTCVAATVDDAIARTGRPALRRHHAALSRAERYAPA